MARGKKSATATKKASDPGRPESWLFLHWEDEITFGVLREKYLDRTNTAEEFGLRKLQPVSPPSSDLLQITAERADVVLPRWAEDDLSTPIAFLKGCDEMKLEKGIFAYLTIPSPHERIHEAWEMARGFAKVLADERHVGSLVIQHVPGRVSSPNDPHVHLLINPRTSAKLGLRCGGIDRQLLHDDGAEILSDRWAEFVSDYA